MDEAIEGDVRPLLEKFLRERCAAAAADFDLEEGRLAEVFRVNRFGGQEGFFQEHSESLPGEPDEMHTRPCFDPEKALKLRN